MAGAPSRSAHLTSADVSVLRPPAPGGVDQFTHATLVPPGFLRAGENIRLADGALSRRPGALKVYRASNPCASKTFGTTGKYATIPAASQLLLGYGGFALHFSVEMTRGAAVAQLIHGQDGADGTVPFDLSLATNGVFTATVNWDGGGSASVSSTALTDASTQHGLFVYDPITEFVSLYLNGSSVGTPVAASAKRPIQTSTMAWLVAAKKTAAAVVTLPWIGAIDSLTLFSLAGTRPASGGTTLLATLLRHSRHQWPNPRQDCVRFNYDMDETSATSMRDTSQHANHATVTGTPTVTAEIALAAVLGNYVGCFDTLDGRRVNVFVSAGRLFYEYVRP